MRGKFNS